MNKNTQMLLGLGLVAVVGYLVWKNNSNKKNFLTSTQNYTIKCGDNTTYTFKHPEIYSTFSTYTSDILTTKEAAIFIAGQDTTCKTRGGINSIRKS